MNRTIALTLAAAASAAALTTAVLSSNAITHTDAPGLTTFEVDAPHHTNRDLQGAIWYPSLSDGRDEIFAENAVFYGVDASENATLADGTYPVIVLSHGMGGHYRTMAWLASDLAKQGAIVVTLNHPYSTWGDLDFKVGLDHWTRAQDLSLALDTVLADPTFAGHIDTSRIMAAGFSYGGWTVLSVGGVRGSLDGYVDHCRTYADASSHCADLAGAGIQLSDSDSDAWDASYADPRFTHITAVDPGLIWGLTPDDVAGVAADVRLIALGAGDDRLLATDFDLAGLPALLPNARINRFDPASHFMFLPLCKPDAEAILESENDDPVCTDPDGSNRTQLHEDVTTLIATDLGL